MNSSHFLSAGSKPDRCSAARIFPTRSRCIKFVDELYPPLKACQSHGSADGISPLRNNCEPDSADGIFLLGGPTLLLRFPSLGGPDRHSTDGISPLRVDASNLSMGDTTTSGHFPICRHAFWWAYDCVNIWYIHKGSLFGLSLDILVSCDETMETSNILKRHSHPGITQTLSSRVTVGQKIECVKSLFTCKEDYNGSTIWLQKRKGWLLFPLFSVGLLI